PAGGWPSLGSVLSKLQGATEPGVLPFVGLSPRMKSGSWADPGQAGFLGQSHAPFTPNKAKADFELNGITLGELGNRRHLLQELDRLKREAESNGTLEGLDAQYRQAFGILTSGKLVEALDLEKEPTRIRERYGRGSEEPAG